MDTMRLLTRRGASCSDLLGCLYDLKPMELEALYQLVVKGHATLDDVASGLGRDRSTAHRCLSKLVSTGLAYKQSKTLKGGGYLHVYSPAEPSRIREHAQVRVDEIAGSLQRLVDGFEADFRRHLSVRI
jgi:predicted transcriptional regulator